MSSQPALAGGVQPTAIDHIIRSCLRKEPDDRWRLAHDANFAPTSVTPAEIGLVRKPRTRERIVWAAALLLLTAAAVLALFSTQYDVVADGRIPIYSVPENYSSLRTLIAGLESLLQR